jgi:hypothetical protein
MDYVTLNLSRPELSMLIAGLEELERIFDGNGGNEEEVKALLVRLRSKYVD